MQKINWPMVAAVIVMSAILVFLFNVRVSVAHDMDHPEEDEWYRTLMQPDNPTASCCGVADAYWCDGVRTHDGKNFCVITDDRVVPGRTPVPVGTEIQIPDHKYKWDRSNPTGHAIVFLSSAGYLYCYVQGGGV